MKRYAQACDAMGRQLDRVECAADRAAGSRVDAEEEPEDCLAAVSITPATAALNRKLGKHPAPRMLTRSEIDLLRQSAREIAASVREGNHHHEGSGSRPEHTCDRP